MRFFNNMMAAAELALIPSTSIKLLGDDGKNQDYNIDLKSLNSTDATTDPGDFVVPGPFLRDFDENPTDLYRFIQMKRWGRVMEAIQKAPEQAKIWIFRTEEDNIGLRWRLLPLHAALIVSST